MGQYTGVARSGAVGFSIDKYGYVGLGTSGTSANNSLSTFDNFFKFDPSATQQ